MTISTNSGGSHKHDMPQAFETRINSIEEMAATAQADSGTATTRSLEASRAVELADERMTDIERRLAALEEGTPEVPFAADYWVNAETGSDTADGRTPATAFKTLARAAGHSRSIALVGTATPIEAADFLDITETRLLAAPGSTSPSVRGNTRSARFQRCVDLHIDPAIRFLPPRTELEPRNPATGEDPGTIRQSTVEVTDCIGLTGGITSLGGTDFGVLLQGTNLRNALTVDVEHAGIGLMLKGNGGVGEDVTKILLHARDCDRMVRNTATPTSDDYGGCAYTFENSTGYEIVEGSTAERCYSKPVGTGPGSYDYPRNSVQGSDGGGDLYDAVNGKVSITMRDCQGGFETGGSSGRGCKGFTVNLVLEGDMAAGLTGTPADGVGAIIRNLSDSIVNIDATRVTRAYRIASLGGAGGFAGPITGTTVNLRWTDRGIPLWDNYSPSTTTIVNVTEVPA